LGAIFGFCGPLVKVRFKGNREDRIFLEINYFADIMLK
jgi:hypothetical protein